MSVLQRFWLRQHQRGGRRSCSHMATCALTTTTGYATTAAPTQRYTVTGMLLCRHSSSSLPRIDVEVARCRYRSRENGNRLPFLESQGDILLLIPERWVPISQDIWSTSTRSGNVAVLLHFPLSRHDTFSPRVAPLLWRFLGISHKLSKKCVCNEPKTHSQILSRQLSPQGV